MAMKHDRFNNEGLVGLYSLQYVQLPLALLFLHPLDFLWKFSFLTEIINEKGMSVFFIKIIILHNHLILNFI